MVEGAMVDYDTATRIESRKLAKIMVGQTAKNMITAFFFNLNAIRAGKSRPGVIDGPKTPSASSPEGSEPGLGRPGAGLGSVASGREG
jgi:3-hydroxyacyl-CoA dehydrogenase/enoyl-CoA hydratase/3-hydroxybutyryl-CoA epimerase